MSCVRARNAHAVHVWSVMHLGVELKRELKGRKEFEGEAAAQKGTGAKTTASRIIITRARVITPYALRLTPLHCARAEPMRCDRSQ